MARILLIDDEPMVLKCIKIALQSDGHDVGTVGACDLALKLMASMSFDVIVTDYAMPRMDGLMFLEITRRRCPGVPVIMITGYGTADTAKAAMGSGAFDYLPKPVSLSKLRDTVRAAERYRDALKDTEEKTAPKPDSFRFNHVVAASTAMAQVCDRMEEAVTRSDGVLLTGGHGIGKRTMAHTIHAHSRKKEAPFHLVDCNAIDEPFPLSSAFSPARGGSVLFHEIDKMPPRLQEELARLLGNATNDTPKEDATDQPLARVMATSAKTLETLASDGGVDRHLLQELQGTIVDIPPLCGRTEDIRIHVGRCLRQITATPEQLATLNPDVLLLLEQYEWPGNVEELEATIKRAWILAQGGRVTLQHLPKHIVTLKNLTKIKADPSVNPEDLRGRAAQDYLKERGQPFDVMLEQLAPYAEKGR